MDNKRSARSLDDLVAAGLIKEATPNLRKVEENHDVCVSPAMMELIDPSDPNDPIAAQFIPSEKELEILADEDGDPIGDAVRSPIEGLVHRYPDRVLLKLIKTCAVYCRFCFRREQVGHDGGMLSPEQTKVAIDYIRQHKEIWEVIFSGGDPLVLSDRRLSDVVAELDAIAHVKVLRVHSRVPVVDPARVTPGLVNALRGRKAVYLFLHCNHARELSADARAACKMLIDGGISILSQSVLLRGVNDTPESLGDLMRAFVENRIIPHYLHSGDLAPGTGHFRVPIAQGQAVLKKMRGNMSGLCQPTYILDLPGGYGKVPVGPVFAVGDGKGGWIVDSSLGPVRPYREC